MIGARVQLPGLPVAHAVQARCKCCGGDASLAGFVDFARDVYHYNRKRGITSGIPVPYYRCARCEFGFTPSFDEWSASDFAAHVYNAEYGLFDPKFEVERPRKTAQIVQQLFQDRRFSILDYGSGRGRMAELLRAAGYQRVTTYDPFYGDSKKPPVGDRFDVVSCFEVVEHTTRPMDLFDDLHAYCQPHGVILFSTKDFTVVPDYWLDDGYVAPRNGHVSLFSQVTLRFVADRLGRDYQKVDKYRHLLLPRLALAA